MRLKLVFRRNLQKCSSDFTKKIKRHYNVAVRLFVATALPIAQFFAWLTQWI